MNEGCHSSRMAGLFALAGDPTMINDMRPLFQITAACFLSLPLLSEVGVAEPRPRWLYLQTNLLVSENVTANIDLLRHAKPAFCDGRADSIRVWLAAGKGLPGIDGAMYTTWQHNFGELQAFAGYAWKAKRPRPKE